MAAYGVFPVQPSNQYKFKYVEFMSRFYKKSAKPVGVVLVVFLMCFCGQGADASSVAGMEKPGGQSLLSFTLEEVVSLALRTNRNLSVVANLLESRKIAVDSIRSEFDIKLHPAVNAGVSDGDAAFGAGGRLTQKMENGISWTVSPGIEHSDESYSGRVGVALDLPLLRGRGKDVAMDALHSNRFSYRTAQRNFYQSRVNLVVSTVGAVYEIVKQKRYIDLYEQKLAQMQHYARTDKIKEKTGLSTPMDLYRTQIRIKNIEDSLSIARNSLLNAEDSLKRFLSLPPEQPIDITAPIVCEAVSISADKAIHAALEKRVEIEQVEDELKEVKRKTGIAKQNLLPQLDLVMGYKRYNHLDSLSGIHELDEDRWSINFVSETDWARTSEKATYSQSLINIRNAKLTIESKIDDIKIEVRSQMESMKKALEQIRIREEQIHQAQGKRELAIVKYNHGMTDNFDLIEADTEIVQARINLLNAQTDYILGTYRLRSVLGTLIERQDV